MIIYDEIIVEKIFLTFGDKQCRSPFTKMVTNVKWFADIVIYLGRITLTF